MAARRRGNPLALAVLALLFERPMHPYEMAVTLRERRKEESIRLNYGSLYAVVQSLEKHGLIRVRETVREGRRPERTVYEITEPGKLELFDWLEELISTPVKEYTGFEAGLSLLPVLPVEDALRLLEARKTKLREHLRLRETLREIARGERLTRLLYLEWEYTDMLHRAELEWVTKLIEEIRDGSLEGLGMWREFQRRIAAGLDPDPSGAAEAADGGGREDGRSEG
ncbi:PadR family transcriptional regulator [Thermostaphylospora chromogena]|uniref:DNA-binding transcriptional regulator, PadR family n=1 Tax=Thermostaphylospora chromogena TaxID=35622 RepID=A0A1H1I744_9ACTN|nr:helix-turn-helix transcriptional regulator [Thermostaphylospora chromogena]SDR33544.1 DNA-binding transcriptional regulator, PadR family [Thermostaphylospora chromogena]